MGITLSVRILYARAERKVASVKKIWTTKPLKEKIVGNVAAQFFKKSCNASPTKCAMQMQKRGRKLTPDITLVATEVEDNE